jgi:hypothetical protein
MNAPPWSAGGISATRKHVPRRTLIVFPPGAGSVQYALREESVFDTLVRIGAHERLKAADGEQETLALDVSNAAVSVLGPMPPTEIEIARDCLGQAHPHWPQLSVSAYADIGQILQMHNLVIKLRHLIIRTAGQFRGSARITDPEHHTAVAAALGALRAEVMQCVCPLARGAYNAHANAFTKRLSNPRRPLRFTNV